MGYIRHHAIAVTSWNGKLLKQAHKKAIDVFGKNQVSNYVLSVINDYKSFFIGPDGSNEGWNESNIGDALRKKFIKWINEQAYEDGSNSISFCEFFYSDENNESKIISHN